MKKIIFIIILGVAVFWVLKADLFQNNKPDSKDSLVTTSETSTVSTNLTSDQNIPAITVIAKNLSIPWDLDFLPDGRMLITERTGQFSIFEKDGTKKVILDEAGTHKGEGGLLGMVLHPQFSSNYFVYLYMSAPGSNGNTENRVERYRLEKDILSERKVIIEKIPGAIYHDGGRMAFGPDGLLYITTGDATTPKIAQDLESLGGKILRLNDNGSIPTGNLSGPIYSYGHRNPQGLAWDNEGRLWSTEHGRSGIKTGLDEINLIIKDSNYGWPESEGDTVASGTIKPVLHSGSNMTWAPASLLYYKGSLFFGGLKGEALYEAVLDGDNIKELKSHFNKEFGRIRTVVLGPDNMLYVTTSNRDGRGSPTEDDDRIIRINPELLE